MHVSHKIFNVFANPHYKNYRKTFQKLIGRIPIDFHVDYVFSGYLAIHFDYNYILLCIVPGKVISKHGHYEKIKATWDKFLKFAIQTTGFLIKYFQEILWQGYQEEKYQMTIFQEQFQTMA